MGRLRHFGNHFLLVLLVAVVMSTPSAAIAESSDRELAQQLYEEAVALFEAESYTAALERLERSYQLFTSLRTLYSMGMCHHALGNYPRALEALEQYLQEGGPRVPPQLRREATESMTQMRRDMAHLTIEVSEAGANVTVDGVLAGTSPLEGPISVGPGEHLIEATLEGFARARQEVNVAARARQTVTLELITDVRDSSVIRGALVRVLALRGARAEGRFSSQTGHLRSYITPSIARGSGVVVHRDGLVATARQLVRGADVVALFFEGESIPRFGRVVEVEGVPNIAFVVAAGEDIPQPLVTIENVTLRSDDTVRAWAHTSESSSSPPRSLQGQIIRLLPDGQAEVALPLAADEVGGPVLDEAGRLLGIVSEARGRGVNFMDPIARFAQAVRVWTRPDDSANPFILAREGEQEAARVVAALAEDTPSVELSATLDRWSTLRNVEGLPPAHAVALALGAYTLWLDILESSNAAETIFLPEELRWQVMRLVEIASFFAQSARLANPVVLVRYPALTVITELGGQQLCGVEESSCCSGACEDGLQCRAGRCVQPPSSEERRDRDDDTSDERRAWFRLGAAGVFVFDDHERAQGLGGGAGTILGHAEFLPIGSLRPVRLSFLAGVELSLGSFRDVFAASLLVDVGLRLALGTPRAAFVGTILYNFGGIWAEKRSSFAYASYRVMAGVQLSRLAFGLSYQETGRGADSTFRGLSLYVDWAF